MNSGKALLRRFEDDLNVCGMGVIILGAWDVLKAIMQLILNAKELFNVDLGVEEDEKAIAYVVIIAIVAILVLLSSVIFLIHYYIGRNACKAARGVPYKKGYYVWAIILLTISVLGMLTYFEDIKNSENIETTIASIIVDITNIYILANVVIATNKIKKLKAEQTQG